MNYLETCLREFKSEVEQTVERNFARVLEALQAGEDVKIPVIDDEFLPPERRTQEYFSKLEQLVVRALVAKKWFEFEAPRWAQPLPLSEDDCIALINQPNRRLYAVARYGRYLRALRWHLERVEPFEIFSSHELAAGPKWY